jgi:hypothetical protein
MRLDRRIQLVIAVLGLAPALAASAQDGGGPHRRPPPEAYSACSGKSASDACSVALRDRTLSGTCLADGSELFCQPERPPHGPPPEAFQACAGKAADDACAVAIADRQLDGTCQATPDAQLFCRPAAPPPTAAPAR